MRFPSTIIRIVSRLAAGVAAVVALQSPLSAEEAAHGRKPDPSPWWDMEWPYRKKITVDTTSTGIAIGEPIGAATVLIRLHDGNFQFLGTKEDASDLRFVANDGKTPLAFHVEKWDTLLNEGFIWVKVPDVKPGALTSFWLYYGSHSPKATKIDDLKGSWDPDTLAVYHFAEKGSPAADSTGAGNNAETAGAAAEGAMIGTGLRLDGKTTVSIPTSPTMNWAPNSVLTWSAWFKPAVLETNSVIYSRKQDKNIFVVGLDNGVPFAEVNGARSQSGAPVTVNTWHHLAITAEGQRITVYLDGAIYGSLNAGLPAVDGVAFVGGDTAGGQIGFKGEIDELQISKISRPLGHIKLAALGQGGEKASNLVSLGGEEQPSGWLSWLEGGHFGIIIKNMTLDGWIVIVILVIMMFISFGIMIAKAGYLNKVTKANDRFLKAWGHISSDLTALDHGDADHARTLGGVMDRKTLRVVKKSSVYRIYHVGVEEIRHRLDGRGAASRKLSLHSIPAIRSALDGCLVRETQKLNSLMVLLTIAISGGPFLGLLGTVIGVMITFAAIAAAGDVNVNSIAPGIAAALLATVAGLGVAIPSLFGYNYLLARVKNATSDMHVFIDEFITKMAEFYCGDGRSAPSSAPAPTADEKAGVVATDGDRGAAAEQPVQAVAPNGSDGREAEAARPVRIPQAPSIPVKKETLRISMPEPTATS